MLFSGSPGQHPVLASPPDTVHSDQVKRVLRSIYALLAMTLLISAGVAVVNLTLQLPAPSLILTLVGYFGMLYAVYKLQNSTWALPPVFALTGFIGYTLEPLLTHSVALPGDAQTVTLVLAATGATFLALSGYVLMTRRDFNFMGGFVFVGMVIALIAGIAAVYLQMPVLGLAVSAMVAFLSANLFTSLLSTFGFGRSNE
jgi:modulator of FtsH protease